MFRYFILLITLLLFVACGKDDTARHNDTPADKAEHTEQGHESGPENDKAGTVHLTPMQLQEAGIVVAALALTETARFIDAPGEIQLNAYRTIEVTPRISAQVISRHARLGDEVELDQALVTLSSVEMAEAQGQLLLADKEWQRVKKLGSKVVSERRYLIAKVEYEKSYANALAYGMNKADIDALLAQKRRADGSFTLVAQQAGRILHDKFIAGERVEAGYKLMTISDERVLWVEARVTPTVAERIELGSPAQVLLDGQQLAAKVVQLHHILDETTRTYAVRLEVDNANDRLHAGMFVTTRIATRDRVRALQLPEAAVLRSADGDWQIMVEQDEPGEFKAMEVRLVTVSDGKAIIEGIQPGTRVVTQGAFFVQSELAKSGFEIHNH